MVRGGLVMGCPLVAPVAWMSCLVSMVRWGHGWSDTPVGWPASGGRLSEESRFEKEKEAGDLACQFAISTDPLETVRSTGGESHNSEALGTTQQHRDMPVPRDRLKTARVKTHANHGRRVLG